MSRPAPAVAMLLAALAACDAASVPSLPQANPAISVSMSSPQLEVARGQVELVLANVRRSGGYGGDVTLIVDGAPAGIRAQVSGYVTENGMTSAYVAVFIDQSVPIGIYNLSVRVIAFGLADAAAPFSVVVEPSGTPAYTLGSRPISILRGTSAVMLTYIDRGSNTRDVPVVLTAEGLPGGVTVSLYPITNAKSLTNMTVTVGAGVPPGHHTITIRGTTSTMNDRITTIPLQVLAN